MTIESSTVVNVLGIVIALIGQGAVFFNGFSRIKVIVEMMLERVKLMESDLKHIAILPAQLLAVNSQVEALQASNRALTQQVESLDKRLILLKEQVQGQHAPAQ